MFIAGDFVYHSARVREAVALVRQLVAAGIQTVAVLDNHDFSLMKESREPATVYADSLGERLDSSAGSAITPRGAGRRRESPWNRTGGTPYVPRTGHRACSIISAAV